MKSCLPLTETYLETYQLTCVPQFNGKKLTQILRKTLTQFTCKSVPQSSKRKVPSHTKTTTNDYKLGSSANSAK